MEVRRYLTAILFLMFLFVPAAHARNPGEWITGIWDFDIVSLEATGTYTPFQTVTITVVVKATRVPERDKIARVSVVATLKHPDGRPLRVNGRVKETTKTLELKAAGRSESARLELVQVPPGVYIADVRVLGGEWNLHCFDRADFVLPHWRRVVRVFDSESEKVVDRAYREYRLGLYTAFRNYLDAQYWQKRGEKLTGEALKSLLEPVDMGTLLEITGKLAGVDIGLLGHLITASRAIAGVQARLVAGTLLAVDFSTSEEVLRAIDEAAASLAQGKPPAGEALQKIRIGLANWIRQTETAAQATGAPALYGLFALPVLRAAEDFFSMEATVE